MHKSDQKSLLSVAFMHFHIYINRCAIEYRQALPANLPRPFSILQ